MVYVNMLSDENVCIVVRIKIIITIDKQLIDAILEVFIFVQELIVFKV